MLKQVIFSVILFATLSVNSFGQIDNKQLYEQKVHSFTKMKRTGVSLTVAGVASTILGIVMVSNAEWETQSSSYGSSTTSNDPNAIVGSLLIGAGVGLTVPGVILGVIGNNKSKEYNEKLQRLNVGINYKPNNKGLVFSYRF